MNENSCNTTNFDNISQFGATETPEYTNINTSTKSSTSIKSSGSNMVMIIIFLLVVAVASYLLFSGKINFMLHDPRYNQYYNQAYFGRNRR